MPHTAIIKNQIFNEDYRQNFLNAHGWEIEDVVTQDSSIRRYFRVTKNSQSAILMETVTDDSPYATPGHSLGSFIEIDEWFIDIGIKAPRIYERDVENGYLLLEDLGDLCFREAVANGERPRSTYTVAARVIEHLQNHDCPLELPNYYNSHVHKRHRRVVDWYVPLVRREKNVDDLVEGYLAAWSEIESILPACPQGFLHIDFHAENLMWLPHEKGIQRCGVLDFQGAMKGPIPYDLANLLEDARNDVPHELRTRILAHFDDDLQAWYRVLATQFHCRVIGQFIKMAMKDDNSGYLQYIPRLQKYLYFGLQNPVLAPLKAFFDDLKIDFSETVLLDNLATLSDLVREDAL